MVARKSLDFREWLKLNEVGTSTGDVASFQRVVIPGVVRRRWPDPVFKKKKGK